jgi:small conductance mechanosensitive channel
LLDDFLVQAQKMALKHRIIDVTLSNDEIVAEQMVPKIDAIMQDAAKQFTGISILEPASEGHLQVGPDKRIMRLKFRIWPGRGAVLETIVRQEIIDTLKQTDASYRDWMVAVNYEVEKRLTLAK